MNEQSNIRNTMKKVTKACIDDCIAIGFPFIKDCVHDPVPLTTNPIAAEYSEGDEYKN